MNNGFTKYRYNQMFFPFCFYVLMDGLFSVYRIYLTYVGGFDWNLESKDVSDTISMRYRLLVQFGMLFVYVLAGALMVFGYYKREKCYEAIVYVFVI
jgi:signal transduction histidine kinase